MDGARREKLKKVILYMAVAKKFVEVAKLCLIKRKTRIWRQFCYTENERHLYGFFDKLFTYMQTENEPEFRKATRMGVNTFRNLNSLLQKKITKQNYIRESIPAECRLAITLMYLGHGVSRQWLAWSFRIGVSTASKIIYETCDAIWDELRAIYLQPPSECEWKRIATQFHLKTGMPHVMGAIDGKHISIICPPNSGSKYYNYKQFFSIVLLAACDSEYTFTAIDVGGYGSQSDGGVLKLSCFGKQILNETINAPKATKVANSDAILPYYFIGDAAFPLKRNLMRPYPGKNLSVDREHFNKRLSRARVKIENTFGILTAKWRVLAVKMDVLPINAKKIVMATVILHNFVKFHEREAYCPENFVDQYTDAGAIVEGAWRRVVRPLPQVSNFGSSNNATRNAFAIRDTLKDYLSNN